jgi:acyl-[acyl carrier protein]--UDP-N-acetylglucosamine O-acyltransferase
MAGINKDIPPFVIASGHYPSQIRGINKRGLKRAGLDEKQQKEVASTYKKLYKNGSKPILKNAKEIAADDTNDENVKSMVNSIIKSSEHRYGRYLELFRD